ncbi:MAG: hypothetical protein LBT26_08425 [Clostridiales Family XIII bacterium]|nr:hypothetical protein [Clostridiales Family XIII bacterium]
MRSVYARRRVAIPRPEFIVLYNGAEEFPDRAELRLSDAFAEADVPGVPDLLELTARVYNINEGHNPEMLRRSRPLWSYASFVARVRGGQARGLPLDEAIREAMRRCIEDGILKEFLETHKWEVENMLFTEFNMEDALDVRYEEGKIEGRIEGEARGEDKWKTEGKTETAVNMIRDGVPYETIARYTGLEPEKIAGLAKQAGQ